MEKNKTAKKNYIPDGAIVRTYYFSEEAMKAFDKKLEELTKRARKLGKRAPKKHQLATKLFCMAASVDTEQWFNQEQ